MATYEKFGDAFPYQMDFAGLDLPWREALDFCTESFGERANWPGGEGRWSLWMGKFWFAHASDYLVFRMRWAS